MGEKDADKDDLEGQLAQALAERDSARSALESLVLSSTPYRVVSTRKALRGDRYVGTLELECASGDGLDVRPGDVLEVRSL